MIKYSANLGFLWKNRTLPDAIHLASNAGFSAVECHWPYATPAADVKDALQKTQLPMLSINTVRGDSNAGDNGLSALPNRLSQARDAIDQAVEYACEINARNIHVMAGNAIGERAHDTFIDNLKYAANRAHLHGITIVIEPLNHFDAPDYFLTTTTQAEEIVRQVDLPNLKLMFDCYHVQIMEGDISRRLTYLLPIIGHIQVASVPDRGRPDRGELNYGYIFKVLEELGYTQPVGAEYRPEGDTSDSLQWMKELTC